MTALLSQFGLIISEVLSYITDVCNTIVGEPLILLTTGFLFLGGVIGILGRLLSRN